ncbi:MAG TPA: DUF438 domain-containing protein [Spirochaetia bacterium]|nr:DUF438 domain-containing protein [Spirochaetia bacterium]
MRSLDERKKKLVGDIIRQLHQGLPVEKAKDRILEEVGRLSSAEITGIEQSLIEEGLPAEEIKRFCNVHALLFEHALEQAVATPDQPAHPVNALTRENRHIEEISARLKKALSTGDAAGARSALTELRGVDRHYAIKENAIFPFLERHGFTGPSKVMWSKHDEIRALLKRAEAGAPNEMPDPGALSALTAEVDGMVFKEEKILFPAALERIDTSEWVQVLKGAEEIGYPYAGTAGLHQRLEEAEALESGSAAGSGGGSVAAPTAAPGTVALPSGTLTVEQLTAMLDTLPVDISFVDAEDRVRYFSQSKDRIFVRATSVLGRAVQDCHPPKSLERVNRIIASFRSGARDHADFWIDLHGKRVHIRYFAVRNPAGKFLGTLEVTQDIGPLQALTGERRLEQEE